MSSLSFQDSMTLKCSFEYAFKLKCKELVGEHIKKGYPRKIAQDTVYKKHSCKTISPTPVYIIDNLEFRKCPCNFLNPFFDFFFAAACSYENGVLPYPGSLSDQPATAMEAMFLLINLKEEYKREEENKNRNRK